MLASQKKDSVQAPTPCNGRKQGIIALPQTVNIDDENSCRKHKNAVDNKVDEVTNSLVPHRLTHYGEHLNQSNPGHTRGTTTTFDASILQQYQEIACVNEHRAPKSH